MKRKLSIIVLVAMLAVVCLGALVACNATLSDDELKAVLAQVEKEFDKAKGNTSYTLLTSVNVEKDGTKLTCYINWEADNGVVISNGQALVPAVVKTYILKATLVDDKNNPYNIEGNPILKAIDVTAAPNQDNNNNQGGNNNQQGNNNQGNNNQGSGTVALTIDPTTLTINDSSATSRYDKYAGAHTINGYTVTTTNVMVNGYGGTDNVLQAKAGVGVITVSGQFSKVVVVFETTYDWSSPAFLLTKDGTNICPTSAPNKVETGRQYTTNGKSYDISSYTVEVTLDASATSEYKIGCVSGASGMRCFASIVFYA